jgi:hypothetical protein
MTAFVLRATRAISICLLFASACSKAHDLSAKPDQDDHEDAGEGDAEAGEADASDAAADASEPLEAVTYHKDVRALVEANCLGCHIEGGAGPFPLDAPDEAVELGPLIAGAVTSGVMPPWPASTECRDLRDARVLSEAQIALVQAWAEGGFAVGNEDDYVPNEEEERIDLDEPALIARMADAYTPNPTIADEYRCFLSDTVFERDTYVTAMDIRPGTREQVHHVQVHKISITSLAAVQALDAEADGIGYPCAGGAGGGISSVNIFSWRPGTSVVAFEPGDAGLIEAGSAIVLQVHYNNQFIQPGESPEPDQSGVALWTLPEGELPDRIVVRTGFFGPVGSGGVFSSIPAGEPNAVGESTQALSTLSVVNGQYVQGEIIGMTPHMHMLGTSLSATMTRASGEAACMIDVPEWDFEWQMDYYYSRPESYVPDDSITVRCEYDNSPANQPIVNGERIQPRNITWGEGSLDEMCLNYVWFRYERDAFLAAKGLL